jgi:hypothetical protein
MDCNLHSKGWLPMAALHLRLALHRQAPGSQQGIQARQGLACLVILRRGLEKAFFW